MAKLKNYNGRYCEYDFENAFITYLEEECWQFYVRRQYSVQFTEECSLYR